MYPLITQFHLEFDLPKYSCMYAVYKDVYCSITCSKKKKGNNINLNVL